MSIFDTVFVFLAGIVVGLCIVGVGQFEPTKFNRRLFLILVLLCGCAAVFLAYILFPFGLGLELNLKSMVVAVVGLVLGSVVGKWVGSWFQNGRSKALASLFAVLGFLASLGIERAIEYNFDNSSQDFRDELLTSVMRDSPPSKRNLYWQKKILLEDASMRYFHRHYPSDFDKVARYWLAEFQDIEKKVPKSRWYIEFTRRSGIRKKKALQYASDELVSTALDLEIELRDAIYRYKPVSCLDPQRYGRPWPLKPQMSVTRKRKYVVASYRLLATDLSGHRKLLAAQNFRQKMNSLMGSLESKHGRVPSLLGKLRSPRSLSDVQARKICLVQKDILKAMRELPLSERAWVFRTFNSYFRSSL